MFTMFQRKDSPYRDSLSWEMLRIQGARLFKGKYIPDTLLIPIKHSNFMQKHLKMCRNYWF